MITITPVHYGVSCKLSEPCALCPSTVFYCIVGRVLPAVLVTKILELMYC